MEWGSTCLGGMSTWGSRMNGLNCYDTAFGCNEWKVWARCAMSALCVLPEACRVAEDAILLQLGYSVDLEIVWTRVGT